MKKIKTILVVGASGATGRLVLKQLLGSGQNVKAIVRRLTSLPEPLRDDPRLSLIQASLSELSDSEIATHVDGCDGVISCLGHNLTFKGLFGHPRRLVTDATRRLCEATQASPPEAPIRFVLMNTTGNSNRDLNEPISFAQKCVIGLLRLLLPPHADNEEAADYLRTKIGQKDPAIEWVAVRPDGLVDDESLTDYDLYASPIRSAIFDAGKTSRINVAHFMSELSTDDDLWLKWKGQMPVIYNQIQLSEPKS